MADPQWLVWARQIAAIAQTGKHYTENAYDQERYDQLATLAAEIIAAHHPPTEATALADLFRQETGYTTPKVDVRGFVLNAAGEVLLVQEKLDDNRWTLPGGWADVNTSPAENCVKEILEESGYLARTLRLLALYDRQQHDHPPTWFHLYKVFFLCELTQPDPVPSPQGDLETGAARWFAEDALPKPEALSTGRVTHEQLMTFFKMVRTGTQTTAYD